MKCRGRPECGTGWGPVWADNYRIQFHNVDVHIRAHGTQSGGNCANAQP